MSGAIPSLPLYLPLLYATLFYLCCPHCAVEFRASHYSFSNPLHRRHASKNGADGYRYLLATQKAPLNANSFPKKIFAHKK